MYAIKIWLTPPEEFEENVYYRNLKDFEDDWYLMRDLDDHIVHTWSRKEKAEEIATHLREQGDAYKVEVTNQIPATALARSVKKKSIRPSQEK
tara:strand:- start:737 stop:1015 length:279 start_codon:yes stop_codon:yes gene_type:complete